VAGSDVHLLLLGSGEGRTSLPRRIELHQPGPLYDPHVLYSGVIWSILGNLPQEWFDTHTAVLAEVLRQCDQVFQCGKAKENGIGRREEIEVDGLRLLLAGNLGAPPAKNGC
jgi:hypothetical protein